MSFLKILLTVGSLITKFVKFVELLGLLGSTLALAGFAWHIWWHPLVALGPAVDLTGPFFRNNPVLQDTLRGSAPYLPWGVLLWAVVVLVRRLIQILAHHHRGGLRWWSSMVIGQTGARIQRWWIEPPLEDVVWALGGLWWSSVEVLEKKRAIWLDSYRDTLAHRFILYDSDYAEVQHRVELARALSDRSLSGRSVSELITEGHRWAMHHGYRWVDDGRPPTPREVPSYLEQLGLWCWHHPAWTATLLVASLIGWRWWRWWSRPGPGRTIETQTDPRCEVRHEQETQTLWTRQAPEDDLPWERGISPRPDPSWWDSLG